MANPALGKSLCSDRVFLGQDFAVRVVTIKRSNTVYFSSGAKPANSKFATKMAKKKKKPWILSFFTVKLPEEARKIEIFPTFQRWMKTTNFVQASFIILKIWKLLMMKLKKGITECHINKQLTYRACSGCTGEYWPEVMAVLYCHYLGPIFPSTVLALG